jgi:hypothetical protein
VNQITFLKERFMKRVLLATLGLVLSTSAAMADQCTYVKPEQAQKAVAALQHSLRTHSFCEPCGDKRATESDYVFIQAKRIDQNFSLVLLDGEAIDLAYTYVNGKNLANTVGCPADGVSPSIRVK